MTEAARIGELAPFGDDGRLLEIFMTCRLAGQPRLAMSLFEAGLTDAEVIDKFVFEAGLYPRDHAPWPDLIRDPYPGRDV